MTIHDRASTVNFWMDFNIGDLSSIQQVKLCDHLQFSHRKRAKPYDYYIRTNFNSCTENFYIIGFHVFNTYTGNMEHRVHNTHYASILMVRLMVT